MSKQAVRHLFLMFLLPVLFVACEAGSATPRTDEITTSPTEAASTVAPPTETGGPIAPTVDHASSVPPGDLWVWPVDGDLVTAFGPQHPVGIDIEAPPGTEVRAARAGVVTDVSDDPCCDGASLLVVEHEDGYQTVYGRLGAVSRPPGAVVASGDALGVVGASQSGDESHVHFELRRHGAYQDPLAFLPPR